MTLTFVHNHNFKLGQFYFDIVTERKKRATVATICFDISKPLSFNKLFYHTFVVTSFQVTSHKRKD